MNFESKTIKECIDDIENDLYVMPAIQREFIWSVGQIEQVFDSLMQDFPISSFLFWRVDESKVREFQFYKFIKHYHSKNNKHNEKYDKSRNYPVTAVLDGQQRLTSLYIGLTGSYAYKLPYGRKSNADAYPIRRLYLDLLSGSDDDIIAGKYDFKFLTEIEISKQDKTWFEVSKILNKNEISEAIEIALDLYEEREDVRRAQRNLSKLWNIVHQEKAINYHLEKTDSLDKVLQIFIRVNSGGTKLSYSDLLLSIATSEWKGKDARQEVIALADEINELGFKVNKDFILKSCLVLSDFKDIAFKIKNFNKTNMSIIENNWERIRTALKVSFETLKSFGLDKDKISSNNAIIPIAYFIFKNNCPDGFTSSVRYAESRKAVYKWLVRTSLKQTFSGQPDNILKPVRSFISNSENKNFPLDGIIEMIKDNYPNKSISFENVEDFDFILRLKYARANTYLVLALLYEGKNPSKVYHQDHVFPKHQFTRKQISNLNLSEEQREVYEEKRDSIANVQLLEGNINQSKSKKPFKEWLEAEYTDEIRRNAYLLPQRIPQDHSLQFADFLKFVEQRERLIIEDLKKII